MRKKYSVKPVTEIELEFPDRTLLLRFDMAAVFHANDLDGGLMGLLKSDQATDICAKIIYMGACEQEKGFSIEDARAIVAMMDIQTLESIMNDFAESLGADIRGELGEMQKKTMLEILEKLAK